MSTGCSIDAVCGTACSYRALAAASCEDIEASSETSALVEPIRTLAKIHPGLGLESNPGSAIGQLDSLRLVRPPCATSSPLTRDENTAFSDAVQGAKAVLER